MVDSIYDKLIKGRKALPSYRSDQRLLEQVEAFARQVGKPWQHWEQRDVFEFVHQWDAEFKWRPNTVKLRFRRLLRICRTASWAKGVKHDKSEFYNLINLYLRMRAEEAPAVLVTRQASPISLETAQAIAARLLAQSSNTGWELHLRLARILALSFSFVGGCRVGDLKHIKWGKIFIASLEGQDAVLATLDWSKSNPYGLKDDDYRVFPSFHVKPLCPVFLWTLFADLLPRSDKAVGPFFSNRTGSPFSTDVLIRGWKAAATQLRISCDFTAHSCRRSRITSMRDMGLSDQAIKKVIGYAPNSKMPSRYDHRKREGNKVAEEKEIKAYMDRMAKSF